MIRFLTGGALALACFAAAMLAAETAAAAHHEPVLNVVTVQVEPGKLDAYLAQVAKLRGVLDRIGGGGTLRVWTTAFGGTDTGNLVIGVEYPNAAAWAAATPKSQADPEWQKILAGLPALRTLVSSSILRDISPNAANPGKPGSGSVLAVTGVRVNPGKLEDYRTTVGKAAAIQQRLGNKGTLRMLRSIVGGPTTGNVAVVVEYPDLASYVAEQAKMESDAEWKKLIGGLDAIRTIGGVWLYQEITP